MSKYTYVLEGDGDSILVESEQEISIDSLTLSALAVIEREDVMKPYPNEHACRVQAPDQFSEFRRGETDDNGKKIGVIYGKKDGTWQVQSYRFKKGVWRLADARSFCSRHGGTFEAAAETGQPEIPGEEPGSGAAQRKSASPQELLNAIEKEAQRIEIPIHIAKAEGKRQLVYGVALEPHRLDTYNDWESPEEIEWAAHDFLLRSQVLDEPVIGSKHEYPIAAAPVESYIAPVDFWFDGTPQDDEHKILKGSWVLVAKVFDPEEWEKVEKEEYTGWSIQGTAYRRTGNALEEE